MMNDDEKRIRRSETQRRYWQRHPEKLVEKNRTYWAAHKDEINRKRREQYAERKNKQA